MFAQEDALSSNPVFEVLWFLTDNQNTTRDLVGNNGVTVAHYTYDSFGKLLTGQAAYTRYLYTGRELDVSTGLQYNRERWYDPQLARWTSEDPIGFGGNDANLYRYVNNSPTNAIDPTGLREADDRASVNPGLRDISSVLEEHVNAAIDRSRRALRSRYSNRSTDELVSMLPAEVYKQLGVNKPGTGVLGISELTEIEAWIETLDSAQGQLHRVPFASSKYGRNTVGMNGLAPAYYNQATANHMIAPTIQIYSALMGADKWGHFFQQGYWLYSGTAQGILKTAEDRDDYSLWMEGADHMPFGIEGGISYPRGAEMNIKYRTLSKMFVDGDSVTFGYFGLMSSGVISSADVIANQEGYKFYNMLSRNWCYKFQLRDFNWNLSETSHPNIYIKGLKVDN